MAGGGRGFVVHNDFSAASAMPTIDARGFVAEAASVGAIGEGVEKVGQHMNNLAMAHFKAINDRKELEADAMMMNSQAELSAKLAQEPDTTKWEGIAAKHTAEAPKAWLTSDLSPDARERIEGKTLWFTTKMASNTKIMAAQAAIDQTKQHYLANMNNALESGNYAGAHAINDEMFAKHYAGELGHQELGSKINGHQQNAALNSVQARLHTAGINGQVDQIDAITEEGLKIPGVNADVIKNMGEVAKHTAQGQVDYTKNKAENTLLGTLAFNKANGGTVSGDMIKQYVAGGQISEANAAPILEGMNKAAGADEHAFDKFITKVSKFDPDADAQALGKQEQALNVEMLSMGLNGPQLQRYNEVLGMAAKQNSSAAGRADTAVKVYGREQIHGLADKLVSDSTPNALEALQDRDKLKKFGLDQATIDSLANPDPKLRVTGPAALELFQTAAKNRIRTDKGVVTSTVKPEEYAKLEPWTKQLYEDAMNGKLATKDDNPQAKFNEAKLLDEFEGWWQKTVKDTKRPPDDKAVQQFLSDKTRAFNVGKFWSDRKPEPRAASPVTGKLTSFAYPGDETPDKNSSAGIGAFTDPGKPETKLKPGDIAVSPDIELQLHDAGISPLDAIKIKLADGTEHVGRWADRTMQDAEARKKFGKPLRGRFDIYSPGGKQSKDGSPIISFSKA